MGTRPKERRSKYMPLTTEGRLSFKKGSSSALMILQTPKQSLLPTLHRLVWQSMLSNVQESMWAGCGAHLQRAVSKAGHSIWTASFRNLHIGPR